MSSSILVFLYGDTRTFADGSRRTPLVVRPSKSSAPNPSEPSSSEDVKVHLETSQSPSSQSQTPNILSTIFCVFIKNNKTSASLKSEALPTLFGCTLVHLESTLLYYNLIPKLIPLISINLLMPTPSPKRITKRYIIILYIQLYDIIKHSILFYFFLKMFLFYFGAGSQSLFFMENIENAFWLISNYRSKMLAY